MAVIETKGLTKYFGEVKAVDGIDLSIQEGELMVILGPSGCGKTTLMRMIAGLEKPTGGEVMIAGENVTELPPRARPIAMVFQSYALYPHMTVFNNIAFPLKARGGFSKEELKEKVEWAASILGIERLLARKPRELSGGERQRVALSRALAKEPGVLLLDEPLSNLDAKLRASARDELQRFQRRLGITTIFVTHDQIEALGMGDRIVVMSGGKIVQVGTPRDVYHDSSNVFVAQFLGSPGMNILEMDDFLVGFRPEQFTLKTHETESDGQKTFSFSVTRVEYLGADQLIYGNIEGYEREYHVVAKFSSESTSIVEANHTYEFVVNRDQLRYFEKQAGSRIEPRSF
ncbi:MAG: ABC transporter ATP-binding protein [Chloroflexota bacterium]|nr:MAG: ABC transporter ATP-binding protein [Chloroflexota bacterium]UCF29294.1 MAG: ABC transporter ATP-binding protein [Chloroflexota bacterium]